MTSRKRFALGFIGLVLASGHIAAQERPAPPPLDAYGDLPGIEDMAISPDGKGLAIIGQAVGERRLVVTSGHEVRTQTPIDDLKVRSVEWAGNDLVLLVTSATVDLGPDFVAAKHEFYGTALLPLDGTPVQQVFAKAPSMVRATWGNYGVRQIDEKWTGYFGGVELSGDGRMGYHWDHGRPALFSVDLARNASRKVARSAAENHWRTWELDEKGNIAAILDVSSGDGRWTLTNSQNLALAGGIDREGDVALISLGAAGDTVIYAVEDQETKNWHWFEVPLAGGESKEVFADIQIERIYVDATSGRLLGYLPEGGDARPVLFDPQKQATMRKVYRAFPNRNLSIQGWTPSFSHLLVRTSGNEDSGTWYVVDMARLAAEPVGFERPTIKPEMVGPISTFAYRAADGLEMDGILTLPPGREAKNLPIVLLPHGGPHSHDELGFDWWAQAFASRGYAVFQPNFRGSTNHNTAFMRAGYGQWGRKMQTDISDGLAALAAKGIVDPRRACIVGASYGGYAALAGVTLQQGLYRCAAAVAPVSDLADYSANEYRDSGGSKMVRASLNESLGDRRTFAAISPRRNAARADAPILLIHGKDDTVVPYRHSTAMADALKDAGRPYELIPLREEDHHLSRAATRKQMLEATVGFVQKHNPAD